MLGNLRKKSSMQELKKKIVEIKSKHRECRKYNVKCKWCNGVGFLKLVGKGIIECLNCNGAGRTGNI